MLCWHTSLHIYYIAWAIFFGKTIGPLKEAIASGILLQVLCYRVRSWFFSQGNHIGYDSGGGIMNYTLRSYGFDKYFLLFGLSVSHSIRIFHSKVCLSRCL